ncbi:hypothetical protein [Leuconostoc lactis]|uniref:hypothetical protein n=1 Tax=Leuconostoc lactis TaxID=1246 RepID=UPI0018981808|nr:hypothetical protein [Leuconostoc lactis]
MRLENELKKFISRSKKSDKLVDLLNGNTDYVAVPPLNEAVEVILQLVHEGVMSFSEYEELRARYQVENSNLTYFTLGPRSFGEGTIEPTIIADDNRFKSAHNNSDDDANGSFDAYVIDESHKIKVEFKATRATFKKKGKDDLSSTVDRAMYIGDEVDPSAAMFDWNFQQIKPAMADVFVLIAAFVDANKYWVFTNNEIENAPGFSGKQHRGNEGEGQIHFKKTNLNLFDDYIVERENLVDTIIAKYDKFNS